MMSPMKPTITSEVDSLFSGYWPRGLFFRLRSHKRFLLQFKDYVSPGEKCLDLGCGPRTAYKPFIEMHGLEWYGADVLESVGQPEPAYQQVKKGQISFDDTFFDVVCMFNVLEHFRNPESMMAEVRRCLTQDGIICGACAFREIEHESYFHMSHKGVKEILRRHGFELVSLIPSEYSGAIIEAQRFFGGSGRIRTDSTRLRILTELMCTVNWIPFLAVNLFETVRRTFFRKWHDPLKTCATLYFYARKTGPDVPAIQENGGSLVLPTTEDNPA